MTRFNTKTKFGKALSYFLFDEVETVFDKFSISKNVDVLEFMMLLNFCAVGAGGMPAVQGT